MPDTSDLILHYMTHFPPLGTVNKLNQLFWQITHTHSATHTHGKAWIQAKLGGIPGMYRKARDREWVRKGVSKKERQTDKQTDHLTSNKCLPFYSFTTLFRYYLN